MGADLWHHEVTWQPDASAALRALQTEQFQVRYVFREEVEMWRRDAEQALHYERESGNRYGLVAHYSARLKQITDVASKPTPESPVEQLASLRRVLPEGFGGVLDVTGINDAGGTHVMRALKPDEIADLFGSAQPTLQTATNLLHATARLIGRGGSVAFPAYNEQGSPAQWVFVGYTVD